MRTEVDLPFTISPNKHLMCEDPTPAPGILLFKQQHQSLLSNRSVDAALQDLMFIHVWKGSTVQVGRPASCGECLE